MPKIYADNTGGGASLPIEQSDVTGLPAALDGKVSKAGDTMSGDLTLPNLFGVAANGLVTFADSSDYNSQIDLGGAGDGSVNLSDNLDGIFATLFGDGLSVSGNVTANKFKADPGFKNVPVSGAKTLYLTSADKGIILIGTAPATGGKVYLPALGGLDSGDFLIANYDTDTITVYPDASNAMTCFGGTGSFTLAGKTAVRFTFYRATLTWYQISPEA